MGICEVQAVSRGIGAATTVNTFSAFSPCQITGFFRIYEGSTNLMRAGSTGAGVNIEPGMTTSVSAKRSSRQRVSIRLNGQVMRNPIVSRTVVDEYLGLASGSWKIQVDHKCVLPLGTGYGTSGGGAASLSLALNDALETSLGRTDSLGIAHVADARAKAGLGTVASVSKGGFAIRVKPGAPGFGIVRRFSLPRSLRVISGSFGPISTSRVLSSNSLRRRINGCSRGLVGRLVRRPDEENFVSLSRRFAECLGLVSSQLRRVLTNADKAGQTTSMMMLGNGAFCIVPRDEVAGVLRLFRRNGLFPVVGRISTEGAHVT